MVKLLKKKKSADKADNNPGRGGDDQRSAQGVHATGNALRDAVVLGLAVVVLPMVIAGAYLYTIRAPAQKSTLISKVAENYATQQARVVSQTVSGLRQRVKSASQSPAAMAALEAPAGASFEAVEVDMLTHFPDAISLRLFPLNSLGTANLNSGTQVLRNNIEVDLVRRASNGEEAKPEAYQHDGQWVASIAQMAVHPQLADRRAVVLVSLAGETLGALIEQEGADVGLFTLEQRVYGRTSNRDLAIVSRGSGGGFGRFTMDIPDTSWRIVYEPSQELANEFTENVQPDFDILALLLGLTFAGFGLTSLRGNKALVTELKRIEEGADHRTAIEVRIPQLASLARELRKLNLRKARAGNSTVVIPAPTAPTTESNVTSLSGIEGPATEGLLPTIFRAYDIRGIADSELDDETVYRIGSAIGTIAGEMGEQSLVLAYDGRLSSGRIKAVLEKALLQSGRDVIDIGLVPTPMMYFATAALDAKSGVMITGSHNAADYNGMKVVLRGETVAQGTIDRIRNVAHKGQFSKGTGRTVQRDVVSEYLDEVIGDIAIAVPLKVVVDASNGATGHIAPSLLEEMGCEVIPLYCEIDGSFPNHDPDTSNEANLADLVSEVVANEADFGVAYDGDGDRLAVVTSSGQIVRTDTLMMILAQDVVTRNPGADVVFDVKSSRNLAQVITSLGGRPVLWKTGHALMKQKMRETGALLGGEFSGHVFFGERWYGFDDGMYATGRLAEILASQDSTLDELIASLPVGISTPEILVPVAEEEKFALIQRFTSEASFPDGKTNDLDGLRVDFEDGWGLLRASNTGPALTARFEASSDAALERIRGQFRDQLAAIAPELSASL